MKKAMLWKVPLALMIIMACILGIIYLFTGQVPVVDKLKYVYDTYNGHEDVRNYWEYPLPISVSRLWDVLFIGILGFLWVIALRYLNKIWDDIAGIFGFYLLIYGFIMGSLIIGMIYVHIDPFSTFTYVSLGVPAIVFILSIHGDEKSDYKYNLFYSALTGLLAASFLGLQVGMLVGFCLGIVVFIVYGLASFLGRGLKSIFMLVGLAEDPEKEYEQSFSDWLGG